MRRAAAACGERVVEAKHAGSSAAAVAIDRAAAAGATARELIEVRVSYAGECGVEEAVSRYLASRENAHALEPPAAASR